MVLARFTSSERGLSLVEVLVALLLLTSAALASVQLASLAVHANSNAKAQSSATILASQKLEQLRALTWGYVEAEDGTVGALASDFTTNLAVEPAIPGGSGLSPSPADSLDTNTAGYVDYIDRFGAWVGTGLNPVPETAFVRRWSVTSLPGNPASIVLQVVVTPLFRELQRTGPGQGAAMRDDARVVAVLTRKAL